jgi:hypothetical protein
VPGGASYHVETKGYLKLGEVSDDNDEYVYVAWWFRTSEAFDYGSHKLIRMWEDASPSDFNQRHAWTQSQYFPLGYGSYWRGWGGVAGEYNFMELEMDFRNWSAPDSIGVETAKVNNSVVITVSPEGAASHGDYLDLMGLDANITDYTQGYQFDWTDIYIDTSPARVLVGNASTYSACTHLEIQPPTAWSNTEITLDFVAGEFSEGDPAWVYVYDTNGDRSDGYSVAIGGGSDPTPISTPALTRTGSDLDLTWTAPSGYSQSPAYYVVYVREGGASVARRVGLTSSVNMDNITVADSGQIDVYVEAYAADETLISTSSIATDGGS